MKPGKDTNVAKDNENPPVGNGLVNIDDENENSASLLRTPSPKSRDGGYERVSRWRDHKDGEEKQDLTNTAFEPPRNAGKLTPAMLSRH